MPEVSSIAGIVQAQDSGIDFTNLANMIMNIKEKRKTDAKDTLQMTMQLAQQGLVEPSSLEQAVKSFEKAYGIKVGEQAVSPQQGGAIQQAGKAGEQPSGAQSSTPVAKSSAKAYPAGGVQPQMEGGNIYENYIGQIRRQAAAKGLQETRVAEMETKLAELKTAGMSGDENARNQLQAMGHLAFDAEFERTRALKKDNPEAYAKEMTATHERALGMETPQQKETRKSNFITNLVGHGYTPEEAAKEFDQPGSSGRKKTMKQLGDEAILFGQLQESFGDETAAKIAPQLAAGASLSDVVPSVGKYQSHFAQEMSAAETRHKEAMDLQREGIAVDKERLAFDKEMGEQRYVNLNERIQLELLKAENADFSARMSDLISAAKVMDIPEEVLDKYTQELARKVGLSKNEAKGWFNWMTPSYVPDISRGKAVLDDFVPEGGGPPKLRTSRDEVLSRGAQEASKVGSADKAAQKRKDAGMMDPGLSEFMKILGTTTPPRITPR